MTGAQGRLLFLEVWSQDRLHMSIMHCLGQALGKAVGTVNLKGTLNPDCSLPFLLEAGPGHQGQGQGLPQPPCPSAHLHSRHWWPGVGHSKAPTCPSLPALGFCSSHSGGHGAARIRVRPLRGGGSFLSPIAVPGN